MMPWTTWATGMWISNSVIVKIFMPGHPFLGKLLPEASL